MKVLISSDSTCDLPSELIKKYNIQIIPLGVSLGETIYKDGFDIDADKIYSYVSNTGNLPKTCAVNYYDYGKHFAYFKMQGYSIVHFSISAEFSSTYQNAVLASQNLRDVHVVDTRSLSSGQGLLVLRAAELAATGLYSAVDIYEDAIKMRNYVDAGFIIDSLDYLVKGGRCSALSMLGANMLRIKPEIILNDGIMLPARKYRGSFDKVVLKYIEDRLRNKEKIDTRRIIFTHTRCTDACLEAALTKIKVMCPEAGEIITATAGSTITSHCGPNTIGVFFMKKVDGVIG